MNATMPWLARASRRVISAMLLIAASTGCWIVNHVQVEQLPRMNRTVESPVRVHMLDGSIALFRHGATVSASAVIGKGRRVSPTLAETTAVDSVPLAQVIGMEAFRTEFDPLQSLALTVLTTPVILGGVVALSCIGNPKCFGSCPTAYSDSAGVSVLEAEGFSYSIARLFEDRDVDRLRATPDASGRVRLEIRNEAFETHFINHVELLDVPHAADEYVVSDPEGRVLALRALAPPASATDRGKRDVRNVLAAHDGRAFASDARRLRTATDSDAVDWIELTTPAPDADSAVVTLRLRNSLLTTVLLYDVMLGDRGAGAVDYLGRDLERIAPAMALGQWYAKQMGLRVSVFDGSGWVAAGRVPDTGPVAWKDVAAIVPVPRGQRTLRVRLTFVTDNWRIDRVAVAGRWRRPVVRTVPLARVVDSRDMADTAALASLRAADRRYLETRPSQRFTAEFEAGPLAADSSRTLFLAWQGYYTEWIRQKWLAQGGAEPVDPAAPPSIGDALRRWRTDGAALTRQFEATRVPVR